MKNEDLPKSRKKGFRLNSYDNARQILQACISDVFKAGKQIEKMGSITNAIVAYCKIRETEIKELEFQKMCEYEARIAKLEAERENMPEKIKIREYE
jgi:hypothetical protein